MLENRNNRASGGTLETAPRFLVENYNLTKGELLSEIFKLQVASIKRMKTRFSMVFMALHSTKEQKKVEQHLYMKIDDFLKEQIRDSDYIFQHNMYEYFIILLSFSGEAEATSFLNRIFSSVKQHFQLTGELEDQYLSAIVVEIASGEIRLVDVLNKGIEALREMPFHNFVIQYVHCFKLREVEKIKASIIENDPISLSILETMLEKTITKKFDIEMQCFNDGNQFLMSNWYHSGHTHIVILNDILPKRNGIEVLHELRSLPNHKKFIVIMISNRNNEENIIFSYENGVDLYIAKPFNIYIFEAQIKRILSRLRLE